MPDTEGGGLTVRIIAHAVLAALAVTGITYVFQAVSRVPFSPDAGFVACCSTITAVFTYLHGIDDDADGDIEED